MNPEAIAERVTVWGPSNRSSSTAVRVTVAEKSSAGMVRVAGTVASDVSSLDRLTVRSVSLLVLCETVTMVVPPFSEILGSAIERVRVGTSSSVTFSSSELPMNPAALVETVTV